MILNKNQNSCSPKPLALIIPGYALVIYYLSIVPIYPNSSRIISLQKQVDQLSLAATLTTDFWVNSIAFLPLGFMLCLWLKKITPTSSPSKLLLQTSSSCLLLSLISESSQFFLNYRVMSANDMLSHLLGAIVGSLLIITAGSKLESFSKLFAQSFLLKKLFSLRMPFFMFLSLTAIYLTLTLYLSWGTFLPNQAPAKGIGDFFQVPFAAMLQGSYLQALINCFRSFLLLLPLGFFLSLPQLNQSWPRRKLRSVAIGGLSLSLLIEFGQIFFGNHYPDISSSIVLFLGFAAGVILAQSLNQLSGQSFNPHC